MTTKQPDSSACWRILTCDLLGENIASERTGIHRRVDLLAIGHQGISSQRVVMLPAGQLTDAPDCAVDRPQTGTVALSPDHAFMVGRGDFASTLNQDAVRIEQQLRVIEGATIAFVDANGHDDSCLLTGVTDGVRGIRRHGHCLIKQPMVFSAHFVRPLDERKVRVIRHHGFRKGGELYALATEGQDLPADFLDSPLAAVEHRTQLDGGGFDRGHPVSPCRWTLEIDSCCFAVWHIRLGFGAMRLDRSQLHVYAYNMRDTDQQSTPKLPPAPTPCLCAALRQASRAVTRIYDAELRETGLRTTQHAVLRLLGRVGEVRQGDLGEMASLEQTSVTRCLPPLEENGWIRVRAGADRREKLVAITPAGKKKARRGPSRLDASPKTFAANSARRHLGFALFSTPERHQSRFRHPTGIKNMSQSTIHIEHVRLPFDKPFDKFTALFEQQLGRFDLAAYKDLEEGGNPQAARAKLEAMAGPSGFMLFRTSNHGLVLRLVGKPRKAMQYLIGNPLFAVEMTRYAIGAALYAPLRVLIYEPEEGQTCVEYDLPSSLFGQFGDENVDRVAKALDQKLEALIGAVS